MATIDGWTRNGMLSWVRKLRTIAIGKGHGHDCQLHPEPLSREDPRGEIDRKRADRHPEHRERERDERKVVQHRHAEDPREQDFVHQRRQGDEEKADIRGGSGLGVRGSEFEVRRAILQSRFCAQAVP